MTLELKKVTDVLAFSGDIVCYPYGTTCKPYVPFLVTEESAR